MKACFQTFPQLAFLWEREPSTEDTSAKTSKTAIKDPEVALEEPAPPKPVSRSSSKKDANESGPLKKTSTDAKKTSEPEQPGSKKPTGRAEKKEPESAGGGGGGNQATSATSKVTPGEATCLS